MELINTFTEHQANKWTISDRKSEMGNHRPVPVSPKTVGKYKLLKIVKTAKICQFSMSRFLIEKKGETKRMY